MGQYYFWEWIVERYLFAYSHSTGVYINNSLTIFAVYHEQYFTVLRKKELGVWKRFKIRKDMFLFSIISPLVYSGVNVHCVFTTCFCSLAWDFVRYLILGPQKEKVHLYSASILLIIQKSDPAGIVQILVATSSGHLVVQPYVFLIK